jgi:Initiator Replication protein
MAKKTQADVIKDLQESPEYVILNNPLFAPKLVRKLGRRQEIVVSEAYPMKLFIEIIARMKPELLNQEGMTVGMTIGIKDFLDSIEATGSKNLYAHVVDCVDSLTSTKVNWSDSQFDFGTNVVSAYKHDRGSGKVELYIYKEFAQKILEVTPTEHFSFLKKHLFRLKNAQSIRLFLFLSRWKNRGQVDLQLDVFKKSFGCDTVGYERFNKIQTRILEPSLKEINEKTEIQVSYEILGDNLDSKKPRVTGLRFFIQEKKKLKSAKPENTEGGLFRQLDRPISPQTSIETAIIEEIEAEVVSSEPNTDVQNNQEQLVMELSPVVVSQFGVSLKMFMTLVEKYTEGEVRTALQVTQKAQQNGKLTNAAGFFVEALRGHYQDAEATKKKAETDLVALNRAKAEAAQQTEKMAMEQQKRANAAYFDWQKSIFEQLLEDDDTFWTELEAAIRTDIVLKNNYNFSKSVFENMEIPMIAGSLMAVANKLRRAAFGL